MLGPAHRGLAAELADDRGVVKGLHNLGLLVVGLQVRVFVPEGIGVVVVRGLLGSFHWYLRLPSTETGTLKHTVTVLTGCRSSTASRG